MRLSMFRRILAAVPLALVLAACGSDTYVSPAARAIPRPPRVIPQGAYDSCAPALPQCAVRITALGRAGFRRVVNYQSFEGSRRDILRYAEAARRGGVKLIWSMKDYEWQHMMFLRYRYKALAKTCRCHGEKGFLRYVVGLVGHLPATGGYYIADEPKPVDIPRVRRLGTALRSLDPAHPRLVVVAPGPADLRRSLRRLAGPADVLAVDSYPVGTQAPLSEVGRLARIVDEVARSTHTRSAMVLQSFAWSTYPKAAPPGSHRWPTRSELRRMRDLALRTSPGFLLWYSLPDVDRARDSARHRANLTAVVRGR